MKIMITVLGILIILAGILPFLGNWGMVSSFISTEQPGYQFVIIAVGILALM